jgi:hypothetical protein
MPPGPARRDAPRPDPVTDPAANDVRLDVPAEPRFARVVRVAVAAAAVQQGLEVAAVEDLRIAVDESLILLLRDGDDSGADATGSPVGRSVAVTIHVDGDGLHVGLQLLPPATVDDDDAGDIDVLTRFTELVPSRVEVTTADPRGGEIRLLLP